MTLIQLDLFLNEECIGSYGNHANHAIANAHTIRQNFEMIHFTFFTLMVSHLVNDGW